MSFLWTILVTVGFFSCSDNIDSLNDNDTKNSVVLEEEIIDVAFYKVGHNKIQLYPEQYWLTQLQVDEYRVGDTMAIRCVTKPAGALPTGARVISQKTDDVQDINFVYDPQIYGTTQVFRNITESIAYISPVKHVWVNKPLISDPTKKQVKIDPKGDILTVGIKYKDQTLIKTIIVKVD